ncbi:MAG: nuclear transport factor 2 family protein [Salinisphaeraceae bacterium]|nr:nuclear transport factor 2 family protein [Salinisphaeraceae bacterium]
MSFSDQDKIDCINKSPAAVAVHDKAAWLGLFASGGLVNDPVGSKPHIGQEEISRFYDTFIAPNQIQFAVDKDTVCGMTVVRDLIIQTTMSTGLRVDVPTHIRYELAEEDGELKIEHLYAHWELMPMVLQTLKQGLNGLVTYAKLSVHMIRCQGFGGVLGFTRGFLGVGKKGKLRAEEWLTALSRSDSVNAREYISAGAELHLPEADNCGLDVITESLKGLRWRKLTAAGNTVTATITLGEKQGVVYMAMNHKKNIIEARFYL